MSTAQRTKKDLYVGTDKHRWWKEAIIYQVRTEARCATGALTVMPGVPRIV